MAGVYKSEGVLFFSDSNTSAPETVTSVAGTYQALASDQTLAVDTSAARTITLALAADFLNKELKIGDATGGGATNNITISMTASDTLNGAAGGASIQIDWGWLVVKATAAGEYVVVGGTL